jgi:predicted dehydrogenase
MSRSKEKIFKAVIIGAGKISCFYDRPQDTRRCATHAHAYYNSDRISLEGIFDIDKNKALRAARIWETRAYKSMGKMLSVVRPDIVSITVPTEFHYPVFKEVLKYEPGLIFMEKPLTLRLEDSVRIVEEAEKKSIIVAVNYQRQWMKEIIRIQERFISGGYGNFLSAVVYYNRGLRNNGSHFLHLLISFLGDAVDIEVLGKRIDYSRDDPTLDFAIRFKKGRAYFVGLDKRYYGIGEIDLFFENGRITFRDFSRNMVRYMITHDRYYSEEKVLRPQNPVTTSPALLEDVVANLADALENKARLLVRGTDALKTEIILAKIMENVH